MTGSFVVAAAELVVDDRGVAAKMLAIPAFMLGAGFAAAIIIARRGRKSSSLPLVFALEALLLAGFVALMLYSWPITDPDSWRGAIAGLLSAAAMGVQSTLVRLLLRGVPQTNVMTGNSTQLAIDATEIALCEASPRAGRGRSRAGRAGRGGAQALRHGVCGAGGISDRRASAARSPLLMPVRGVRVSRSSSSRA